MKKLALETEIKSETLQKVVGMNTSTSLLEILDLRM